MSKQEALASLARQVVERVQDDALTPVTLSVEHAADLLESLRKPKPWERCGIHGPAEDRVWACPACLVELRTEVEALRADAERYRWLRAKTSERSDFYSGEECWMVSRAKGGMGENYFGDSIDQVIDAARSKT